jgi:hypothetical protein
MAGVRVVGRGEARRGLPRCSDAMDCAHDGFHGISSSYDRLRGVLVYHWTCERCGAQLSVARREPYRPAFDPYGAQAYRGRRAAAA